MLYGFSWKKFGRSICMPLSDQSRGIIIDDPMFGIVPVKFNFDNRASETATAAAIFSVCVGKDLLKFETGNRSFEQEQCLMFLNSYLSTKKLISSIGHPNFFVSAGLGEIVALTLAGAFSFEAGFRLACERSKAFASFSKPGYFLSTNSPWQKIDYLIKFFDSNSLQISYEDETKCVLSGNPVEIQKFEKILAALNLESRKLNMQTITYSVLCIPALPSFINNIKNLAWSPLKTPVFSTTLGRNITPDDDLAEVFCVQMVRPVHFGEVLRKFKGLKDTKLFYSDNEMPMATNSLPSQIDDQTLSSVAEVKVQKIESPTTNYKEKSVQDRVLNIFQKMTSYPIEILDLNSDLESEMGIDSVKRLEILATVLEEFKIPIDSNLEVGTITTIGKAVQSVEASLRKIESYRKSA